MKCRILEALVLVCALALSVNAQTPVIISQPQSLTINNASTATFTVVATNAAQYQWQFQGANIAGATDSTLTYDDVTNNQAGSYTVVVTSSANISVTSSPPAVLTILPGTMVQITFSGFPDGSSSNVLIQLFDHDKPDTVENFLHYITPAVLVGVATNVAFSNMVWDRCLPGFVLQGGDYDATDRTNATSPPQLEPVYQTFVEDLNYEPHFPFNIDNEFAAGPLIHNKFGTLAMAKNAGDPNSAANGFFFNLGDNSSNLDYQNGGFTVFGRAVSGSNVLQYFNTLSKPDKGIFDITTVGTNQSLTDVPVNDHTRYTPANSNLFFADFAVLTAVNVDTNPPTVVLNYPTDGQTATNADLVFQGTASDDVALARVVCSLPALYTTVTAAGTTNWTADFGALPPGSYLYDVVAQDGAGNLSTTAQGTVVVPRFPFESSVTGNGTLSTNLNGTNTTVGSTYAITARPGSGAVFANWTLGTNNASLNPTLNFTMTNGMQVTANFIANTMPGGISFTYPAPNAALTNATFSIKGKVAKSVGSAQITCQVFSASSGESVSRPMVINATYLNATNTWSTPLLSFTPGNYIVQAVAQAANGHATVIIQKFTVLAQLTVIKYGLGRVSLANGSFLRLGSFNTITATPAAGQSFLSWNAGGGSVPLPTISFYMSDGLTLTATFVSNSLPNQLTFTSPRASSQVTSPNFTLSGKIASSSAPQVFCQLFQNNAPLTSFMPATVTGTTWTLPVTNLTMGSYAAVAIATDASGKSTLASDKFVLNFYPSIAGAYHGLFFDPAAIAPTNAGSISFNLSSGGVVVGNLTFPLRNYPLYFGMGPTGSIYLQAAGFNNQTLYLKMIFDFTNFSGGMTGYVAQGNEVCPMTAYRAATKLSASTAPAPGAYVLNLEPVTPTNGLVNGPLGDSFAAVKVAATGNLAVAGTLADATSFSQSTGVFTNGVWPIYATAYHGYEMLIGWETNLPSGACTGTLFWVKSPTNGFYYTNGLYEELNSLGAKFVPPSPGTNYQIVFGGGTFQSLLTNLFSFKGSGASFTIVPAAGTTDNLTGTLLSTGVLKGSISNPFNNKTLQFSGTFVNPSGGGGFTLDTGTQTGYFQISSAP